MYAIIQYICGFFIYFVIRVVLLIVLPYYITNIGLVIRLKHFSNICEQLIIYNILYRRSEVQMSEYSKTHIKYLLLFLLLLTETLQNCVKFNDADGSCLQCKTEFHLYAGKCFNKLRGCDQHKVKDQKILSFACKVCIPGYTLSNQLCIRDAIYKKLNGVDAKTLNENRGTVASDNNDYKQNITYQNSGTNQQKTKDETSQSTVQSSPKPLQKADLKFPQILLGSINEPQKYQISDQLSKLINQFYPDLTNKKPTKVDLSSSQFILAYQQGSILLASALQDKNGTNIKNVAQGAVSPRYAVIKLGQNVNLKNFLASSQSYKYGEVSQASLNINMVIKNKEKDKRAQINLDMQSGQIKPVYSIQCQKQKDLKPKLLQDMRKEYEAFFPTTYLQFKQKTTSLSTPQNIAKVKAMQDQKSSDIIYKVYFQGDEQSEEYAIFKYKVDRNQTEVLGYFIQGSDVFAALKNAQKQSSNSTNTVSQPEQTNVPSQILTSNSGNSFLKTVQQTNGLSKLFSSNFSMFNPFSSYKPKLNFSSYLKTNETIMEYLKSRKQFTDKAQKNYKLISFQFQISQIKSEITYKLKFLVALAYLYVNIIENVETKIMAQFYQLDNSQACMDLPSNDGIVTQLDINLQRGLSTLFNNTPTKMMSQYKIEDQSLEKYLLYYYSGQQKKYFYEVSKTQPINSSKPSYKISKYGSVDKGYYFEKKQYQNLMLPISDTDFDSNLLASNGISVNVVSILNQFKQKYKPYIQNSSIVSLLYNTTHYKYYITNKMSTFEILKKTNDILLNSVLNLIDSKYGYEVWPIGMKNGDVANINSAFYQKLQQALLRKSSSYLNSCKQIYIKKINELTYQIAFKTAVGYYGFTVTTDPTITDTLSINMSPIKKISQLEDPKIVPTCKPNVEILQVNQKICYKKVIGCYKQIGNICIICQTGLVLQSSMKQCRKACGIY